MGRRPRRKRLARPFHEKRRDERVKLTANYLNGIAIAIVAIGAIRFAFAESGVLAASSALWLPIGISAGFRLLPLLFLARHHRED